MLGVVIVLLLAFGVLVYLVAKHGERRGAGQRRGGSGSRASSPTSDERRQEQRTLEDNRVAHRGCRWAPARL